MAKKTEFLKEKIFQNELKRCEYCEEKPCRDGCPANCSPCDFIMAVRVGEPQDYKRAAAIIMRENPLGGVCGFVCPDKFCMAKCSHKKFDSPVKIPEIQATIVQKAKELGEIPGFSKPKSNGKKIAIIGSGPAGLSAAAILGQEGYEVTIFEAKNKPGGMCNLIPDWRLPKSVLRTDIEFIKSLGNITIKLNKEIKDVEEIEDKFDAVLVATGLWEPIMLGIKNENLAITSIDYLSDPKKYKLKGKVAVIGGGATACDCAITLKLNGAKEVEMFALETYNEMPLTEKERNELFEYGIQISNRIRVTEIKKEGKKIKGIKTVKATLKGEKFDLKNIKDIKGTEHFRPDIKHVIIAIGNRKKDIKIPKSKKIFFAGDYVNGPTTVVEAVASGKNAALRIDAFLKGEKKPKIKKEVKSFAILKTYKHIPVSLETDFFGRKIQTPFLISASPPSDGYEQMKKAYENGWSGGIMKTSFAKGPIHIPSEYMHVFNENTYGNCDNVSGHLLDRVCKEAEKLVKEYPDRLTMVSTGGPVTGNDEEDKKVWQSNTKILEETGIYGIEYSLSCPQGGEGTEGDIVSQSPTLTAKIVDWIMEVSNPDIPKLFKLTAAVTSIETILNAIKEVLKKYPNKKAGVTLANTFPVMDFQNRGKKEWEDGVILGMSGEGVLPISYFTLARAVPIGIEISGNAGPMNYKHAANFLALGVKTVQFCTIVMKYGYGIFQELCNGVAYLMRERGIKSMKELIGIAQPNPIKDFMELPEEKKISQVIKELCVSCGNCTRCPYQAITLNKRGYPETDPSKCIGCSICVKKCFTGALYMRERTKEELEALKEG